MVVSSCSEPSVQMMDCSGRTQRREPGFAEAAPERMGFGQGKLRMMPGMASAMMSAASRPGFWRMAT